MNTSQTNSDHELTNGSGAAAILAAGIGSAAMGIFSLAGDAWDGVGSFFTFYKPTGGLSGVSTTAVIVWLVSWYILNQRWKTQSVDLAKVNKISFALLAVGVLLTFPPVMDFIQGR